MFIKLLFLLTLPIWANIFPSDSRTVGLWQFNEGIGNTIADVSGNNLNATKTGGTWTAGVDSNCVNLNYDEYVTITNNSKLHYFNKITVESWVYLTAANINSVNHEDIIGKGDALPYGGYHLCVLYKSGGYAFHFYVESDTNTGDPTVGGVVDPATYTYNQWFYVAGVYDGDSVYIYVNGTKTASSYCKVGRIGTANGNLYVNRHTWANEGSASSRLQGKFDEIRISDTARSAENIKVIWNAYNLVAYYPFSSNANDSSGDGNDGTVTGATLASDRFGNSSGAYDFSGTSYIQIPPSTSLDALSKVTIAAWIKTSDNNSEMAICIRDNTNWASGGRVWQFNRDFENHLAFVMFDTTKNGNYTVARGTKLINDGRWHFVVGTKEADSIRVYVDGVSENAVFYQQNLIRTPPDNIYLGRCYSGTTNLQFTGNIDDVRIYNRALSAGEVDSLYRLNGWTGYPDTGGLIAYYPFSDNANDESGNGNDGLVSGATLSIDKLGNSNQAYSFDSTDFIDCGNGLPFQNITNLTVAAWMKTSNDGSYMSICSRDEDGYGRQWQFVKNDANKLHFTTRSALNTWDSLASISLINNGNWHFVVGTRTNDTTKIYVDGVMERAKQLTNPMATVTNCNIMIGSTRDTISNNWVGSIDEVRIYNRAISASEVDSLYNLMVGPVNNAPQFISSAGTTATEDSAYSYSITVVDVDLDDTVTLSLDTLPSGMTILGNVINWTPTNSNVGNNRVVIRASDNHGAYTQQKYTIAVTNTNDAPVITSTPPTIATQNLQYQYPVTATDVDVGDAKTYAFATNPSGMVVSGTGLITWTPNSGQIGTNSVKIYVRDASLAADSQSWSITVGNVNDAPVISTIALDTATEDIAYVDTVKATDPDGNAVFWYLLKGPDSLKISLTTGVITWMPLDKDAGNDTVRVRATDGVLSDTVTLIIHATRVNDAPVIQNIFPDTFFVDSLYTITLVGIDEENDNLTWSIVNKPSTMTLIDSTIVWAPTASQIGNDTILIIVSDGSLTDTLEAIFEVIGHMKIENAAIPLPTKLSLTSSPNPANPTVNLSIGVPSALKQGVSVQIVDINGKTIRSWQVSGAGYHKIAWNGRDYTNTGVSSGLYLVRVTGAEKVLQKKILLLK